MTTFGVMQARIADEIARTDLTTQIKDAIKTAIKKYERRRYYFNQKVDTTFSTVADQEYYGSAALADIPDIAEIDSATVTLTGVKSPLDEFDHSLIDSLQNGQVTGTPEAYSYAAQKIRLYPIPSGVMTITLSYIYRFATLSLDADTNAWMTDGEELIRCAAKAELYEHTIRNAGAADRMRALAEVASKDIMTETARRTPRRRMVTDAPTSSGVFDISSGLIR